ncbi:carboxylesterase family protein [Urbifossiella limnaea]|uniref:Putative hydrolase n=1 Tax=Urbifossiella limnaea TaxID=2528023 RepID=A0A517XYJ8_9BACT|nr:prolyl oligopeptidase family serine peptidase [Urbifossiella limnaea]QDU22579.1 putative hydrolase [Urbifossiella limnaea]
MTPAVLMLALATPGQPAEPEAKTFTAPGGKALPYRLIRPAGVEPGKKYPLVLVLHGAGERGSDNTKQLIHVWEKGTGPLGRAEVKEAKAFALLPQCPDGKQWVNVPWAKGSYTSPAVSEPLDLALQLVDASLKELPIDPDRVYVMGLSMGGYGTFDAIQRRPGLFAAAVPVCGAMDVSKSKDVAKVAVWAFHGDKDTVVPPSGSREAVAALRAAGAQPRYTEYPGVGHNSWAPAFRERELWTWVFAQRRGK